MLFACIHVPDFPVQALMRSEAVISFQKDPVAVLDGPDSLLKIYSCNQAARNAGIVSGMTKLQAEACPGVVLRRRVSDQESLAQSDLLACAGSFSPRAESTAPGTVLFDLTGAGRLLGSEREIARQVAGKAADYGFAANVALAANADTALHAARGFPGMTVVGDGEEAQRLAVLPVEVLEPSSETLDTFASWGIRDLRALAALPAVPLTQRLGQQGLHLQRLARGEIERELVPAVLPPSFQESLELEESVDLLEPLGFVINRLLDELISRLRERSLATDHLELNLGLEIHRDRQLLAEDLSADLTAPCATAEISGDTAALHQRTLKLPVPTQDSRVLLKLLQLDLAAHPPAAPVKKVSVELFPACVRTTQTGLFQPLAPEPAQLEITLARLRAAVGEKDEQGRERVGFAANTDSHRPDSFQVLSRAEESGDSKTQRKLRQREIQACLPAPQLVLRRFRPPFTAWVECSEILPQTFGELFTTKDTKDTKELGASETYLQSLRLIKDAIPATVIFNGTKARVTHACGPWRAAGSWWDRAAEWQRDEWDVALTLNGSSGLYRIFHDLASGQWFVEGMYD
jgi:protein ImuB